jgi:hypothetical protein
MCSGDWKMDERLKKTIVLASLGAFAMETYEFALQGKIGHAMPSALQVAPATSTSTSVEVFLDEH